MPDNTRTQASDTTRVWASDEASADELEGYVSGRLGRFAWPPDRPTWLADELAASWTRVLAETDGLPAA